MASHLQLAGATLLCSSALFIASADALPQERETVLDGVVHVEDSAILEIPETPRLEAGLDLIVHRIDVGDAELYVEEEGAGVPIIVINGGPGGTHHYFHPWFSRASGYARVIYYDQRGTGLSDFEPGPDGYSVEQAVADLDAIRVALGVDKWVLVGYSYGGFLAQYYTTIHPENVAGLVLVGAKPGMWTDTGSSRQYDYLSQAERDRMRASLDELRSLREEDGWSRDEFLQLLLYNNFINGDWKRQHFYKPSPEKFAHIALYEWVNDSNFNSIMNQSGNKVDLTGAFENNPIPTLLLEGKWDLTWGDVKPTLLSRNHPRARMTIIEDAGHSIYDENPDVFFAELEGFVRNLTPVADSDIDPYRRHLDGWRATWMNSPRYYLRAAGWGKSGSLEIAEAFSTDWLDEIRGTTELLRIGFALYDTERYDEALEVFTELEESATGSGEKEGQALGLIWQGHMLDLMERREEAIARYQRVVDMGVGGSSQHSQYGLAYTYTTYAAERLEAPFERIENSTP
jgi:proline-specific peptidase